MRRRNKSKSSELRVADSPATVIPMPRRRRKKKDVDENNPLIKMIQPAIDPKSQLTLEDVQKRRLTAAAANESVIGEKLWGSRPDPEGILGKNECPREKNGK